MASVGLVRRCSVHLYHAVFDALASILSMNSTGGGYLCSTAHEHRVVHHQSFHPRLEISPRSGTSETGTLFWSIIYHWQLYDLDNPRTTTHT